jgi:hypothetical protein
MAGTDVQNFAEVEEWTRQYDAPDGQLWVCGACGKSNRNRVNVGDESCFLNAVLCYDRGGVLPWEAVSDSK